MDSTTPSLTTLGTALREIAQNGSTPCDHTVNPLQAHFELHIEQGPLLEQEQKLIGVVHSIHEIRRYNVAVNGRRGHAGTVPMAERTDALMAACRVALMVEQAAIEHSAFATVGTWSIEEPSPNVIPGRVEFTLDVRHPCRATMCDLEKALHRITKEMMQHIPALQIELSCAWESPAATFDERAVGCVRSAAKQAAGEGSVMPMKSLAGHDTALTAMRVPSAMIFVPSRGGISHAPEEFTSKSHW